MRYSPKTAATRMGVSSATVRRLLASGELKYHRVKRRVIIRDNPRHEPASANNGTRGKLVNTKMLRNPPVTISACGRMKICCINSRGIFDFCVERVTSKPAASEIPKRMTISGTFGNDAVLLNGYGNTSAVGPAA